MATLQVQPGQPAQLPVQTDSQRSQPDDSAVAAVAEVLASSLTPAGMVAALAGFLLSTGIKTAVLVAVLRMVLHRRRRPGPGVELGPALRSVLASEPTYQAAYLLASARRVQTAVDAGFTLEAALSNEQRYLQAHYQALDNRRQAGADADTAARRWSGPSGLIGWKATLDRRTSPECRAANGRNFPAGRQPLIGWPGAVHPHCRCRPTRPFRGASLLPTMPAVALI